MRILHTSDWHLGRGVGACSLADDQAAFVHWLVGVVREQRIDLVVIAGDLYDRAVPPAESVVLLREALIGLRAAGASVVAVAGNHDGAERVAAYDGLTDAAGIHLRGGYARAGAPIVVEAADGPLDVIAVPYLDPLLAPGGPAPDGGERLTHHRVLEAAVSAAGAALGSPRRRTLAVAHAFVRGCMGSDSERLLTVGGAGHVDVAAFGGAHYVALGHLHRPQVVGDDPTRRYCGSPLAYSFSEDHTKQVVVVEMDRDGRCRIEELPVEVGRPVATLVGTLESVLARPSDAQLERALLRVVLTDPVPVVDAAARLRRRFAHVVEVEVRPAATDRARVVALDRRRGRSPLDVAAAFWADVVGAPAGPDELAELERTLALAELQGRSA